jgi:pimeloyl-ACP methyl ester carboxylesterase
MFLCSAGKHGGKIVRWLLRITELLVGVLLFQSAGFAQDRFFDSNGVSIRYTDSGRGEPIVLLHGGGASLEMWTNRGITQDLERDYRVITLDLRGHGKSDKPLNQSAYGLEVARDVIRLLDHLDVGRTHVAGVSLGAFVAARLLAMHPERLLTATLIAGGGVLSAAEIREAEGIWARTERDCLSRLESSATVEREEDARECAALGAAAQSMGDLLLSAEEAAAIELPTLGIVGSLDTLPLGMRELKRLRPDMKLVIVEGATHGFGPADTRAVVRSPELLRELRALLAATQTAASIHLDGAVFEPARDDPRIAAVIATYFLLAPAMERRDVPTVQSHMAADLVVNAPINAVVDRSNVLERLREGEIAYEPERNLTWIEFVGVRGDAVVVMGEQRVYPMGNAPEAGKTVRRRFTDVWQHIDDVWKLTIRQATIFSTE